jgi:TPR repeat protein
MLLSNELDLATPTPIPDSLILPPNTPHTDALAAQYAQARDAIERAAYLCLPITQYKTGALYEQAALGYPYDPLISLQWYSLASQGGEMEADMALSKWFLCGAEGYFERNEELARTFAEKAARRGHPNLWRMRGVLSCETGPWV